jgi:hypothetical protein
VLEGGLASGSALVLGPVLASGLALAPVLVLVLGPPNHPIHHSRAGPRSSPTESPSSNASTPWPYSCSLPLPCGLFVECDA